MVGVEATLSLLLPLPDARLHIIPFPFLFFLRVYIFARFTVYCLSGKKKKKKKKKKEKRKKNFKSRDGATKVVCTHKENIKGAD